MSSTRNLRLSVDQFQLVEPFYITGHCFDVIEVVTAEIEEEGVCGKGEASGIYYRAETPGSILGQLESFRSTIEAGVDRAALLTIMPSGGARNAIDAALWDLEAKKLHRPVWELAGLGPPRPLVTTFSCGADTPEAMAAKAASFPGVRAIKLKLTGGAEDAERVRAVREALPHVWLGVDANQGFDRARLEELIPEFVEARVALIEQPFPVGEEAWLDELDVPIPLAADESAQTVDDIARLADRFAMVNIKLDKCGGLTAGLEMARAAREHGMGVMAGCMAASSLGLAPAFVLGQLCEVVDLDAPAFLKSDRTPRLRYRDGTVDCPPDLWGCGAPARTMQDQMR